VAQKGEILWEEGFDWADRENRIPATEHTMYYGMWKGFIKTYRENIPLTFSITDSGDVHAKLRSQLNLTRC